MKHPRGQRQFWEGPTLQPQPRGERWAERLAGEEGQRGDLGGIALWLRRGGGLVLGICLWSGCVSNPWFAERTAREVSKEQLTALADEGVRVLYLGSQGGYHYLREGDSPSAAAFKVDDRALKLGQTFGLHSEEPYEVYPHVIVGRKLGQKPKPLPGF